MSTYSNYSVFFFKLWFEGWLLWWIWWCWVLTEDEYVAFRLMIRVGWSFFWLKIRNSVRMYFMVPWTTQDVYIGGSSLYIKKLWEIRVCLILSFVNMTLNFLEILKGNVQLSVLCLNWLSLVCRDVHFWCH